MKVYLVGGAVRDELLGLPVEEKDWVVVGATVADMLQQGYLQVGKDFPVFLHPVSKEEYALARTERKVGRGYTGFTFDASPQVTLEEDLLRRDLTINAIAQTSDGQLIDPYHGQDDLNKKILRHVSAAFIEDPVRILRVARFSARFADFRIASDTLSLMQHMVQSGEVDALVAERVWKEVVRALGEDKPEQFFKVLADCGALTILFPPIKIPGPGMNALTQATKISSNTVIRFAALLYDVSAEEISQLCERYRIPQEYRELARLTASYFQQYIQANHLTATALLQLLKNVDAFRREQRFKNFLITCKAIARAVSLEQSQANRLQKIYETAKAVDIKKIMQENLKGKAIAEAIDEKRIAAIEQQLILMGR